MTDYSSLFTEFYTKNHTTEAFMSGIGTRIKELRKRHDISQEELAAQIKVSRGNVGDWERSRAKPGADALIALSSYFSVSIDWILNGQEFQPPHMKRWPQTMPGDNITPEDIELLAKLKRLSEKERWKVEGYIDAIAGGSAIQSKKPMEKLSPSPNGEEAAASEGA
jgi:transcriptional regulator with XRE-family HTH domain